MLRIQCDMEASCTAAVTHMDEKGFVYCATHGNDRKNYCRCRKLTAPELRVIAGGGSIHYDPKLNRSPKILWSVEAAILFQRGNYFAIRARRGFEVYRCGATHAVRCASIGDGPGPNLGLDRAIAECERRAATEA